jgi:hypothetical protein
MEDWYGERGDFTSLYVNGVQIVSGSGSAAWGSITGTLSNQTDLQTALNGKQSLNTNLTGISGVTPSAGYLEYTGSGWTIGAGGGSAAWGSITGTLSNQTDLNSALNGKQASSAVLTGLAGLSWSSGSPIVRMNGASSFALDTNTYLTGNQTITLGGDLSGSGSTSISGTVNGIKGISLPTLAAGFLKYTGSAWTFDNSTYLTSAGATAGTYNNVTVAASGLVTSGSNVAYLTSAGTSAGTYNNVTVASSGLVTSGSNTAYLTGNQTITLSGDVTGSGTTAITATLPTVNSNVGTYNNVTINAKGQATAGSNVAYLTSAGTSPGTYNNVTVNSSGLVTSGSNAGYLTANQSISFSPSGDISSSGGSGTTSLTPAITVTGIQGEAVPALSSGWLKYNGSSLGWSTPTLGDVTASGAATGTASTFSGGLTTGGLTINDNTNVALGTTHGTDIGTATNQKLGFYNVTPIVQPTGDALTALSNLGLVGTPTLSNSDVGLGNVENTKLSTWSGSSNITTLGTVTTGTLSGVTLQGTISSGTGLTLGNFSAGTISNATLSSPVFSGTVGSNIALASGYNLNLVNALTTTNTWSGVTSTYTNNEGGTINRWQLVYLDSSGEMELAEGNASSTMPCVAIATASISNGSAGTFMTYGYARDDSDWSWTPNGLIFVSDGTAGALTQTAPTGTGHQVQVVGVAITAHIIYFYPQITIIGLK